MYNLIINKTCHVVQLVIRLSEFYGTNNLYQAMVENVEITDRISGVSLTKSYPACYIQAE